MGVVSVSVWRTEDGAFFGGASDFFTLCKVKTFLVMFWFLSGTVCATAPCPVFILLGNSLALNLVEPLQKFRLFSSVFTHCDCDSS